MSIMCEKLVHVATTSSKFQHTEYLKPSFLETLKIGDKPGFVRSPHIYQHFFLWFICSLQG